LTSLKSDLLKHNTGFHEKNASFGHGGFPNVDFSPLLLIREHGGKGNLLFSTQTIAERGGILVVVG